MVIGHNDLAGCVFLDHDKIAEVFDTLCADPQADLPSLLRSLLELSPAMVEQFERSVPGRYATTALERFVVHRGLPQSHEVLETGIGQIYERAEGAFTALANRLFKILGLRSQTHDPYQGAPFYNIELPRPSEIHRRAANANEIVNFLSTHGADGLTELATELRRVFQPDWRTTVTAVDLEHVLADIDSRLASIGPIHADIGPGVEAVADARDIILHFLPELTTQTGSIFYSVFARSFREEINGGDPEWIEATRAALTSTYELVGHVLMQSLKITPQTVEELQLQARDFAPEVLRMYDGPGFGPHFLQRETRQEAVGSICDALNTILQIQNLPQLELTLSSLNVVNQDVSRPIRIDDIRRTNLR